MSMLTAAKDCSPPLWPVACEARRATPAGAIVRRNNNSNREGRQQMKGTGTRVLLAAVFVVASAAGAQAGNGAPKGAHYNLNIHGVPKNKTASMTNGDGHSIFVSLDKTGELAANKIWLVEGPFAVLDANATDAD